MMMFCKKCGAELPDNAKFCAKCGATVGETDVEPIESADAGDAAASGVSADTEKTAGVTGPADAAIPEPAPASDAEAADHTVAMPVPAAENAEAETDSAPAHTSAPKKASSRRAIVAGAVAAGALAVSAAALFVLPKLNGEESSSVKRLSGTDKDDKKSNKGKEAKSAEGPISKKQLSSDLGDVEELTSAAAARDEFVDGGSYELSGTRAVSQKKDGDKLIVKAETTAKNDAYTTKYELTGTYYEDGDGDYTSPTWTVDGSETTATAGLERDPQGRWADGKVSFDKKKQTCAVKAEYAPSWFEKADGDVTFNYAFNGNTWNFTGMEGTPVTYDGLVATYKRANDYEDGAGLTAFEITEVDKDGNAHVKATFHSLVTLVGGASAQQRDIAFEGSGKLVPANTEYGEHRVTCKMILEAPVEGFDDIRHALTLAFAAGVPTSEDDPTVVVHSVLSTFWLQTSPTSMHPSRMNEDGAYFSIPQEQSPTKKSE